MSEAINWYENEELFEEYRQTGKHFEKLVAARLRQEGFYVAEVVESLRDHISNYQAYTNDYDIELGLFKKTKLEVKSSDRYFTSIEDFPFRAPLLNSLSRMGRIKHHPRAYLIISQQTGAIFVAPTKWHDQWFVDKCDNRKKGIKYDAVYVPKSACVTFERLIEVLRQANIH